MKEIEVIFIKDDEHNFESGRFIILHENGKLVVAIGDCRTHADIIWGSERFCEEDIKGGGHIAIRDDAIVVSGVSGDFGSFKTGIRSLMTMDEFSSALQIRFNRQAVIL